MYIYSNFIGKFQREVNLRFRHHHCRCMIAFPDDYKALAPKLLVETMVVVGSNFVSRINLATGDVIPETKALAKGFPFASFRLFS